MPRDLSDVLHYFGPELAEPKGSTEASAETRPHASGLPTTLPIVGVPIGERDVVRAAFTWNLAVEIARLGGRALVVSPDETTPSPLWPVPGPGPLGVELRPTLAKDLESLQKAALEAATAKVRGETEGGLVFVRIPPAWLETSASAPALMDWTLLFTSSATSDLREALRLARAVMARRSGARVGVTIHGVHCRSEAETAFERVARATRRKPGSDVTSYGLLVDDLQVYRAIVAQRPIGLAHPQSPAARALRDVAQLLLDDGGKGSL